jgi:ssDNA-binding Zn-finger/Zn-ribbon topoisomerase 1
MEPFLCPGCKKPLKLKHGLQDDFFGCTGFPRCKVKVPVDSDGGADYEKATGLPKYSNKKPAKKSQIER